MTLRIAHAIHSVDPNHGGTVEAVRILTKPAAGTESVVLCSDAPRSDWTEGWQARVVQTGPSTRRFGFNSNWRRVLPVELSEVQAAVIHGMWQYHAMACADACRRLRVPYFVFPHGMLDPWALQQSRWLKRVAWLAFNRRVIKHATGLCFTTDDERALALPITGALQKTNLIVPLGVEEPPDQPLALRLEFVRQHPELAGKTIVLFLGRLHPKKGCDMLIDAFAAWRKTQGVGTMHLRLAGPCDDTAFLANLKQRCHDLGLQIGGDVSFPGMVTGRAKWTELAAAGAMILPSHQENFGLVVGEALACGCPVLLSDKVNTWKNVAARDAGLVEGDTVSGTTSLLQRFGQLSAADLKEMSHRARRLYQDEFSADRARNQFVETVIHAASLDRVSHQA